MCDKTALAIVELGRAAREREGGRWQDQAAAKGGVGPSPLAHGPVIWIEEQVESRVLKVAGSNHVGNAATPR